MTTPLERLLIGTHGFSAAEAELAVTKGHDTARTPLELWAHWMSYHCRDDNEFKQERYYKCGFSEAQLDILLGIVKNVEAMCNAH